GKGIIRHLGTSTGDRADEGGLASIGHAQQADIGQHPQLELELASLTGGARGRLARRAVDRALEMDIAEPALAPSGHQQPLAMRGQVPKLLAGGEISHDGADRDLDGDAFAAPAIHLAALTVLAPLGSKDALVAKISEGVDALVGLQPDAAAIAAIAAVGTAARHVFLAAEAHRAVAAVAGNDLDHRFVYEFHANPRR